MLKFLGCGSGFNSFEIDTFYNRPNSAYFELDHTLYLIDAGEGLYKYYFETNKLKVADYDKVVVFITHLHADHVAGLAPLVTECCFKKVPIKIFRSSNRGEEGMSLANKQIDDETGILLDIMLKHRKGDLGYGFISEEELPFKVTTLLARHDKMPARGFYFEMEGEKFIWTGDDSGLILEQICDEMKPDFRTENLTVYHEVGRTKGCHTPLEYLCEKVPEENRKYFTLMHFKDEKLLNDCRDCGFNIPSDVV